MIIGFLGNLGSGKTVSMTALSKILQAKTDLFLASNISIDSADRKVKSVKETDDLTKTHEGILALDEVWAWADSRDSQNNQIITELVLYSRKRGWILLYTVQSRHQADKRLDDNTDYYIMCEHKSSPNGDNAKMIILNNSGTIVNEIDYDPSIFYDAYDTKEEVNVQSKKMKLKPYIEEYEDKVDDYETKKELKSDLMYEYDHELSNKDVEIIIEKVW